MKKLIAASLALAGILLTTPATAKRTHIEQPQGSRNYEGGLLYQQMHEQGTRRKYRRRYADPPVVGRAPVSRATASRACLNAETKALLNKLEDTWGKVKVVSTCDPGRTMPNGDPSWHRYGKAFDFEPPPGKKGEIMVWLTKNSPGVTMSYARMKHIHTDTGNYHKTIYNAANEDAGWRAVAIWKAREAAGEYKTVSLVPMPKDLEPKTNPNPLLGKLTSMSMEIITALDEAREYVIKTVFPGGTMKKNGVENTIGLMHPVFITKLSGAIAEARRSGLPNVGCFSGYRKPGDGVGGYKDKFDSQHTYGLACDMHGIGKPGSKEAKLWHKIATKHGLYNPYYGTRARWEWNHYQITGVLKAVAKVPELRKTVKKDGPPDVVKMWRVADRTLYLPEERYVRKWKRRVKKVQYASVH